MKKQATLTGKTKDPKEVNEENKRVNNGNKNRINRKTIAPEKSNNIILTNTLTGNKVHFSEGKKAEEFLDNHSNPECFLVDFSDTFYNKE